MLTNPDTYLDFNILDVANALGITITGRCGDEYTARCPLCGDKPSSRRGHLYLNVKTNQFYCHLCANGGSALKLYALCRGITNKEAYKELIGDYIYNQSGRIKVTTVKIQTKEEYIAPLEQRDKVYNMLLNMLTLERPHIQNLKKRGLDFKEMAEAKYRTVPYDKEKIKQICSKIAEKYELEGVPGFYTENGEWVFNAPAGMFVPVRDVDGKIKGMQVRVDNPGEKGKYRWFSSNGRENGTKAQSWTHVRIIKGSKNVVITEGPLKADVAAKLSNMTFVGVPGVNSLKELPETLKQLALPRNAVIYVAYDMDKKNNPQVLEAQKKVTSIIRNLGYRYKILEWDCSQKGIDDYLLAISPEQRQKLFTAEQKQQNVMAD